MRPRCPVLGRARTTYLRRAMLINGEHRRTIWLGEDGRTVRVIDQTLLPHELRVVELRDLEAAAVAIERMQVRGAPLIGAAAAYGV